MENLKVVCAEDCGNSPKKQLLRDITISLAKQDIDSWMEWMRDDIEWDIVGEKQIHGKTDMENVLKSRNERKITELEIHNIITHGNTASLNATLILANGKRIEYCDVYNFGGFGKKAKIKKIMSYVIQ